MCSSSTTFNEAAVKPNPLAGKAATVETLVDVDVIRGPQIRIGVDPLGGASVHYWERIAQRCGLIRAVVSDVVDPIFVRCERTMWTTAKDGWCAARPGGRSDNSYLAPRDGT